MFTAFFLALFKIGIPVAITAYLLIGFLLDSGKLEPFGTNKELGEKLKSMKEEGKKNKKEKKKDSEQEKIPLALKKWLSFGGGFYGAAAFYTYIWIEFLEVVSFFFKMLNPANWRIDLSFEIIISFFINSIMNFVAAITWFMQYDLGGNGHIWAAFLLGYFGYAVGARFANRHYGMRTGHVDLWRWWRDREARKAAEDEA